ncbi:MAG: hypothetical protein PUC50_07005 [Bacteroidales bacterium]|nr:hypothetical protein [Bacteroidales bacterium]
MTRIYLSQTSQLCNEVEKTATERPRLWYISDNRINAVRTFIYSSAWAFTLLIPSREGNAKARDKWDKWM